MILHHFLLDVNEANAFLLGCEETKEALLVDAGEYPAELDTVLNRHGLKLSAIFITHDHWDHTAGLADVVAKHPAPIYAYNASIEGQRTTTVKEGDTVKVGTLEGLVLETPGHTPDGVSLAFPSLVFTGDALFSGSIGGTASPGLANQLIDHVRRRIFTLPPETELHTGHGPASTVAIEQAYNPFFV